MRVLVACEFSGVVRDAFAAVGHESWSCDLVATESLQPVVYAADLPAGEDGEPWCELHQRNYGYCVCLGPTEDGAFYTEDGQFGARHVVGDVREILEDGWDLMIAHPPCTYLCSSGLHWNKRVPGRDALTEEALEFVRRLLEAPIPRIALENPIGCIGTRIRRYDQVIQPHQFGHDASKQTCLWLKNLPPLRPTQFVNPQWGCRCGNRFGFELGKLGCPKCGGTRGAARPVWGNQTAGGQNRLGPSPTRASERARTYPGIAQAMADQWGRLLPRIE